MASKINPGTIVNVLQDDEYGNRIEPIVGIAEEYDTVNNLWCVFTKEWGIMLVLPQDMEVATCSQ